LVRSFLAFAFEMGKADDYAKSIAASVLEESEDLSARELAQALVEFYNTNTLTQDSLLPLDQLMASQAQKTSKVN
jgi:hypothetical protein